MHSHEGHTDRWFIKKGFWKEIALPSGLKKAMNPSWQRRAGACFFGGEGRGRTSAKAVGQQCTVLAPPDTKRLAAAAMNSSPFSSVEKSQHRKKKKKRELLGLFVVSGGHFFVSVPFTQR